MNMFVDQDEATALSASLGQCDYIAFLDGAMVTTDEALAEVRSRDRACSPPPAITVTRAPRAPPPACLRVRPASVGRPTASTPLRWAARRSLPPATATCRTKSPGSVAGVASHPRDGTSVDASGQRRWAGWEFTNQGGRGVPDVAALADRNTPYLVYSDHTPGSQPAGVAGTSVSSPLTLGLWASTEGAYENTLGLAQYDFYNLYNQVNPATSKARRARCTCRPRTSPVAGFRDITLGTNGGCVAKSGYDYCTGIGSVRRPRSRERSNRRHWRRSGRADRRDRQLSAPPFRNTRLGESPLHQQHGRKMCGGVWSAQSS